MTKEIKSQKVQFDVTELKKTIIYMLEDTNVDEGFEDPLYFDINGLKFYTAERLWDYFEDIISEDTKQGFTKLQITENDEYLFTYLQGWGFKVTRIPVQTLK
jgi:hypothetical protein